MKNGQIFQVGSEPLLHESLEGLQPGDLPLLHFREHLEKPLATAETPPEGEGRRVHPRQAVHARPHEGQAAGFCLGLKNTDDKMAVDAMYPFRNFTGGKGKI